MKKFIDKKKRVKFTGDMTTNAVYKSELNTVVKKYDKMPCLEQLMKLQNVGYNRE